MIADMKESYLMQVEEYAKANNIVNEAELAWCCSTYLHKWRSVISKVKSR